MFSSGSKRKQSQQFSYKIPYISDMEEVLKLEQQVRNIMLRKNVPKSETTDVVPPDVFVPQTKYNVCYIVASIIFDERGRVLMIQEAKKSCRGQWYLPAGRLEPGESLVAGAKRECQEESGLLVNLTSLVYAEFSGTWARFTFTGNVVGGKLKTEKEQDSESIQAKYFSDDELAKMRSDVRAHDVFKLIEEVRLYLSRKSTYSFPDVLPIVRQQKHSEIRLVVVDRSDESQTTLHVLGRNINSPHLPHAFLSHPSQSIRAATLEVLGDAIKEGYKPRIAGVLGIEHQGSGKDDHGICTTILVCLDVKGKDPPPKIKDSQRHTYDWYALVDPQIKDYLLKALRGGIVPLIT